MTKLYPDPNCTYPECNNSTVGKNTTCSIHHDMVPPRDRCTYIGSSDAKDILAGNWSKLYRRKKELDPPDDLSDQFNVQLGVFTEEFHIDWTVRRMVEAEQIDFEVPGWRQREMSPPDVPYVASHVDAALSVQGNVSLVPLEVKHSSGKRTMDELLEWYMPQVRHHLWCMGSSKGVISVIQGNLEPERLWIGRSQDWIEIYAAACEKFWDQLQLGEAPPRSTPADDLITPKIKDAIPVNDMVRRNGNTDNLFMDRATTYVETKAAHARHEATKKALKADMKNDEGEIYSNVLTLKRNKAGSIGMTINEG